MINSKPLRIVVADDEPLLVEELSSYLHDMGYEVVGTAATGEQLKSQCEQLKPDLVVADVRMPDLDGFDAARAVCETRPTPFVIISAYHDDECIDRTTNSCIMSYLVKPTDQGSLKAAVSVAMRRFKEYSDLVESNENLRQTLEDRKIIERAKGVIMKRASLDEEAAFQRIRKAARERSIKMVAVARAILESEAKRTSNRWS